MLTVRPAVEVAQFSATEDDCEQSPRSSFSREEEEDDPMEVVYLSDSDENEAFEESESSEEEEDDEENLVEIAVGETIHIDRRQLKIMAKIGEGVFGKVYKVCDEENQQIAMKVMEFTDVTRRIYACKEVQFLNEISASVGNKKHIVDFYGAAVYGYDQLMFFELMGDSLEDHLTDKKPKFIGEVAAIGYQLLTALAHLHSIGMVHTDLKPTNVLFPRRPRPGNSIVKLCDFGNAVYTQHLYRSRGRNNLMPLMFRAPEVYLGIGLNEKIDLWSLGCVLAELYTGYQLFPADTLAQLCEFHFHLLPAPDNYQEGLHWAKFLKLENGSPRPLNEVEFHRQGYLFQKDRREMALFQLEDLLQYGLNSIFSGVQEQDRQFVSLMKGLLDPNNGTRLTAADAMKRPFFSEV